MAPKEWLAALVLLDYQEKMVSLESTVHQEFRESVDLRENLEALGSLESPDLRALQVCQEWLDPREVQEDPELPVLTDQLETLDVKAHVALLEALAPRDAEDARELLEERATKDSEEHLDLMVLLDLLDLKVTVVSMERKDPWDHQETLDHEDVPDLKAPLEEMENSDSPEPRDPSDHVDAVVRMVFPDLLDHPDLQDHLDLLET